MTQDPYILNEIRNFLRAEADRIENACRAWDANAPVLTYNLPPLPGDISYGSFAVNLRHWAMQIRMLPEQYKPKGYFYQYPKADHTVDAVIFDDRDIAADGGSLRVLLIKRGRPDEPFYDCWALPGGFLNPDETLKDALVREVREELNLNVSLDDLEDVGNFDVPDRDPRGRVISTVFAIFVTDDTGTPKAADDAKECRWFSVDELPPLAFDHGDIIHSAMEKTGLF